MIAVVRTQQFSASVSDLLSMMQPLHAFTHKVQEVLADSGLL